jgi:hypothetical protein
MANDIYYEKFNEKTLELFNNLSDSFPDIVDFKKFKTGIIMMSNLEPKSAQRIFKLYISDKFREQILNKDEQFFLVEAKFDNCYIKRNDYWIDFINRIKTIWTTISLDEKEIIWKFLHILLLLSDKCCV